MSQTDVPIAERDLPPGAQRIRERYIFRARDTRHTLTWNHGDLYGQKEFQLQPGRDYIGYVDVGQKELYLVEKLNGLDRILETL